MGAATIAAELTVIVKFPVTLNTGMPQKADKFEANTGFKTALLRAEVTTVAFMLLLTLVEYATLVLPRGPMQHATFHIETVLAGTANIEATVFTRALRNDKVAA